jgi:hypothetical protein
MTATSSQASQDALCCVAADLSPSDRVEGQDALETLLRSVEASWWSRSIEISGRHLGILGLAHLEGDSHLVWLASTPSLFKHPLLLVRQGRAWLERLSEDLGLDVWAVCPPSNTRLLRLLKAWGFDPTPAHNPYLLIQAHQWLSEKEQPQAPK